MNLYFLRLTNAIAFLALLVLFSFGCSRADEAHQVYPEGSSYAQIEVMTDSHTRVVWVRDIKEGSDTFAQGTDLVLMGFDSRDGRGERAILESSANYSKPFITPRGDRVVYTDRSREAVMIVDWDGSNQTQVVPGVALAVWIDPESGNEWLYVGTERTQDRAPSYHRIERLRLDDWAVRELVWDLTPVSEDNFHLSVDGRFASGLFPWPDAGVATLPNVGRTVLGRGCWVSLSPDDRRLLWVFDGAHRNLTIFEYGTNQRWQLPINQAPGIDGYEVYHPRWSNHSRFMAMTGPYTVGGGGNKIRGGGKDVSIYVGRFSDDFRSIEGWVRLTGDQWADFYPDVWLESGLNASLAHATTEQVARKENIPATEAQESMDTLPGRILEIQARLVENSVVPSLEAIAPYDQALVANKYVVEEVISGEYPHPEIMVAHWAIRDGKKLDTAERTKGETFHLVLAPYEDRPELEGERLAMDSDEYMIPLFFDLQS
ncbi:TolB-like translocation protein [Desulfonatronum parangueonense]